MMYRYLVCVYGYVVGWTGQVVDHDELCEPVSMGLPELDSRTVMPCTAVSQMAQLVTPVFLHNR